MDAIPFFQSVHFTPAARTEVKWIVIHCMEGAEKPSKAIDCARWMAGLNPAYPPPKSSAHYFCDSEHIAQGVLVTDVAWHAPGANRFGIGIEHAGKASQTRAEWLDEFSTKTLKRSAELTASLCATWGIPINYIGPTELRAGIKGITTHFDCTKAWPEKGGTHHDPGTGWPMDWYLHEVSLVASAKERVELPNV